MKLKGLVELFREIPGVAIDEEEDEARRQWRADRRVGCRRVVLALVLFWTVVGFGVYQCFLQ
jgi:hypothetical protein